MLKRLGMWNRLAVVAAMLVSFGGSSWMVLSDNLKTTRARDGGYQLCVKTAFAPNADGSLSAAECGKIWYTENPAYYQGWQEWWVGVGALLVLCAVAYLLMWASVAIAKWIWRGRTVSQS